MPNLSNFNRLAELANIESPVWGLSVYGYGVIVEGLAAIRQRISVALRTTKGSDPLRPLFGSNVYKYQDAPLSVAIPNIKYEIIDCLGTWVTEIKLKTISHYVPKPGNVVFEITYTLRDEDLEDKVFFSLSEGISSDNLQNEIILQAFFPPNPNSYRYQVRLLRNGNNALPLPNPEGYTSIQEMFEWITENWGFYGRWYQLYDRIVCYMSAEGIISASLSIEVLPITVFSADFPELFVQVYGVSFKINEVDVVPAMPVAFSSPGDVLVWAQNNWSEFATWSIQYFFPNGDFLFSDEFSPEFDVAITGYRLVGVTHENVTPSLVITPINI